MNDLDKWAAAECGVVLIDTSSEVKMNLTGTDGNKYWIKSCWILSDPRCREIFREWWLNNTNEASVTFFKDTVEFEWIDKYNDSMACYRDTELLCIQAIYEDSKK